MGWLVVLGLISLLFMFAGCSLARKRILRYRQETEMRRAKAFAEMAEIAESKKAEHRTQNAGEEIES